MIEPTLEMWNLDVSWTVHKLVGTPPPLRPFCVSQWRVFVFVSRDGDPGLVHGSVCSSLFITAAYSETIGVFLICVLSFELIKLNKTIIFMMMIIILGAEYGVKPGL